jgi:hypothetical protein
LDKPIPESPAKRKKEANHVFNVYGIVRTGNNVLRDQIVANGAAKNRNKITKAQNVNFVILFPFDK